MHDNKLLVPFAIVIAGGLVAAAIFFGGGGGTYSAGIPKDPQSIDVPKVTSKDHIVGSPDAKVVIVEYSDTECPFCKIFHQTIRDLVAEYDGQVAWVYRHFPIVQLHAKAPKEAEATECAAEIGGNSGFWNFINKLFEVTNSNDTLSPSELPKIAASVGLDVAAFNACLTSGKYAQFIEQSIAEAYEIGAGGTPYSFLIAGNKKLIVNGAEPYATVKAKIDSLLK